MFEMAVWKFLYWAVVILYLCAIAIVALVFALCVVVIIKKIIEWRNR